MAAGQRKILAIAIFSADPAIRRSLEQLLREDSTFSIVGVVDDPAAISLLIDQNHVNVVLADVPPRERLADWRLRHNQTAFVIFVDIRCGSSTLIIAADQTERNPGSSCAQTSVADCWKSESPGATGRTITAHSLQANLDFIDAEDH